MSATDCSEMTREAMRIAGVVHPMMDLEPAIAEFLGRLLGSYLS